MGKYFLRISRLALVRNLISRWPQHSFPLSLGTFGDLLFFFLIVQLLVYGGALSSAWREDSMWPKFRSRSRLFPPDYGDCFWSGHMARASHVRVNLRATRKGSGFLHWTWTWKNGKRAVATILPVRVPPGAEKEPPEELENECNPRKSDLRGGRPLSMILLEKWIQQCLKPD